MIHRDFASPIFSLGRYRKNRFFISPNFLAGFDLELEMAISPIIFLKMATVIAIYKYSIRNGDSRSSGWLKRRRKDMGNRNGKPHKRVVKEGIEEIKKCAKNKICPRKNLRRQNPIGKK